MFEVSYARRDSYRFVDCHEEFPTELDAPCIPGWPDVFIGNFNSTQISDTEENMRSDQLARMYADIEARKEKSKLPRGLAMFISNLIPNREKRHLFREKYMRRKE